MYAVSDGHSCSMEFLWQLFIIFYEENDCSAVAKIIGVVKKIINDRHTTRKLLLLSNCGKSSLLKNFNGDKK